MLYNPMALFALRLIAQEREKASDDLASGLTGKPLALASALVKVSRSTYGGLLLTHPTRPRRSPAAWWRNIGDRARRAQMEGRILRLLRPSPARVPGYENLRLTVSSALLASLLFFVV